MCIFGWGSFYYRKDQKKKDQGFIPYLIIPLALMNICLSIPLYSSEWLFFIFIQALAACLGTLMSGLPWV